MLFLLWPFFLCCDLWCCFIYHPKKKKVAGVRMRAPIMKIHTVAAGGGLPFIILFFRHLAGCIEEQGERKEKEKGKEELAKRPFSFPSFSSLLCVLRIDPYVRRPETSLWSGKCWRGRDTRSHRLSSFSIVFVSDGLLFVSSHFSLFALFVFHSLRWWLIFFDFALLILSSLFLSVSMGYKFLKESLLPILGSGTRLLQKRRTTYCHWLQRSAWKGLSLCPSFLSPLLTFSPNPSFFFFLRVGFFPGILFNVCSDHILTAPYLAIFVLMYFASYIY